MCFLLRLCAIRTIALLKLFHRVLAEHLIQYQRASISRNSRLAQVFRYEYCKIFIRTPFYIEHLWWLLLYFVKMHFVAAFETRELKRKYQIPWRDSLYLVWQKVLTRVSRGHHQTFPSNIFDKYHSDLKHY